MRRFEFSEGSSNKFWEIEQEDEKLHVRYGKIGTAGQTQTKELASATKATLELSKLIKEKTGKGYTEVDASNSAPISSQSTTQAASQQTSTQTAQVSTQSIQPPQVSNLASPPQPSPPPQALAQPAAPALSELSSESGIHWTPELLAMIHPNRNLHGPAPVLDAYALEAELLKSWKKLKPAVIRGATDGLLRSRMSSFEQRMVPGRVPMDIEVEAVGYHMMCAGRESDYTISPVLVQYWIAAKGPLFALQTLMETNRLHYDGAWDKPQSLLAGEAPYPNLAYGNVYPWDTLREYLSSASKEEWDSCISWAQANFSQELASGKGALAFVFPGADFAAQAMATGINYPAVGLGIMDPALFSQLLDKTNSYYFSSTTIGPRNGHAAFVLTLLANGIPPKLIIKFIKGISYADTASPFCAGLAYSTHPDVISYFISLIDDKKLSCHTRTLVDNHPAQALHQLAQAASSSSKSAVSCIRLLTQVLRAHPELEAAARALPEGCQRGVQAALEKLMVLPEAKPADLPSVLVDPPWLKKATQAPSTVLKLTPLPYASQILWPEGIKESSSKPEYQGGGPKATLQSFFHLNKKFLKLDTLDQPAVSTELRDGLKKLRYTYMSCLQPLPQPLALSILNEAPASSWYQFNGFHWALAVFSEAALPALVARARETPEEGLDHLMFTRDVRVAHFACEVFSKKKGKAMAERWLRAHPECAAYALLPVALGPLGKDREAAEAALRYLGKIGFEELVLAVADKYGREARLAGEAMLNFDPRMLVPTKVPKLPYFFDAKSFSKPMLPNKTVLPDSAIQHIGTMLAFSGEEAYIGLQDIKALCTSESLGEFVWDLFSTWQMNGAPNKESWAFKALGHLGNDETARRLTPLIRQWPGESLHQRAVAGLDVLAMIGSDVALMNLDGIARKVKFKGLQEKAQEKIAKIAEDRGLTSEELADRLVPDLGLDEDGKMLMDFGSRQFTVGFDELLQPVVLDASGARLKDLPKPIKSDDATKAKEAGDTWKNLKKDAKTLASSQLLRLELAMYSRRRWSQEVFELFLAGHPLLKHVVRRLVWGIYSQDGLLSAFRVAEDGSYADEQDNPLELPEGAVVGVAHAMELSPELTGRFRQLFMDYEILQPFEQLSRSSFRLTDAEKATSSFNRWAGLQIPTGKVLGLENRAWRRGPAQDAGWVWWYVKPFSEVLEFQLTINPGIGMGFVNEYPIQTVEGVSISRGAYNRGNVPTFGSLDPILVSELIRDIEGLR